MTHLFFDGSLSTTLVGLTGGPKRSLPGRLPSDGLLFQNMHELLDEAQLCLNDVSSIAVGSGPGSHTGTRALAALAKGLAIGLAKPFKLFPSLLLSLPQKEGLIGTSLATRRDQIYVLAYDTKLQRIKFSGLLSIDECERLKTSLDFFGHDDSTYHLDRFLENAVPSSLSEPLHYLNFS